MRYQAVQARVKSKDKLRQKYVDPQKNYRCLEDITDQAGLRVITYYEDEVDRVIEILKKEFEIDPVNSVDKRESEPDKFGYYAVNYVCRYPAGRTALSEYKRFSGIWCEVQVTSIFRHAWSEIEHPWYDLRDAYPSKVKRRFRRMAALLEIAESEFLSLRKLLSDYEQSVAVRVEAGLPDMPVDAVSLRSFIEQDALVAQIDNSIAALWGVAVTESIPGDLAALISQTASLAGLTRLQQLRSSLARYQDALVEYVRRCREFWPSEPRSRLPKGVSVLNLTTMLVSAKGEDLLIAAIALFGGTPHGHISRQVAVAREVLGR